MSVPPEDSIAIDTNIFMHLFQQGSNEDERKINSDSHIDTMLEQLQRSRACLLIDDRNKVVAEHIEYLHPIIKNCDETDTKALILRYWILDQDPFCIELDVKSRLYAAIKQVIHEKSEAADRAYVYISHSAGKPLVTNDIQHILFGPTGEGNTDEDNRRTRLKKLTKKLRTKGACLYSSREASECFGVGNA